MTDQEPKLYTRRDLLGIAGRLGLSGAGALLAASLPGSIARSDGVPTPEGPRLLCENPHFKNNPEVNISNTHLMGMVVCFPDQPEGIAAVERSNLYHDGLERQLGTAQGFFSRFMKTRITSEVQREPRFLMSNLPYSEYIAKQYQFIDVTLPTIYYDGSRYPIFVLMYVPTPNPHQNLTYPGTRGSYITFNNSVRDRAGDVTIPWLLAEREGDKEMLWHEIGHAYGMGHNLDNYMSIMALGVPGVAGTVRRRFGVDPPVLDSYDLGEMCPSYGPNYQYKVLMPISFGPPSP